MYDQFFTSPCTKHLFDFLHKESLHLLRGWRFFENFGPDKTILRNKPTKKKSNSHNTFNKLACYSTIWSGVYQVNHAHCRSPRAGRIPVVGCCHLVEAAFKMDKSRTVWAPRRRGGEKEKKGRGKKIIPPRVSCPTLTIQQRRPLYRYCHV